MMDDDLDVYNIINADTDQGSSFLNYKKKYNNNHDLLAESSSSEVGSIVEALDGTDSISQYKSAKEKQLSADQATFNTLLSQYTTLYNTYIASIKTPLPTDSSNNVIIANLRAKNTELIQLAEKILGGINSIQTTSNSLNTSIQSKQAKLKDELNKLQIHQSKMSSRKYDMDSVDGVIETTSLSMNSSFMQYIVYFFIGITLLVFIFNMTINPEADIMKASFFLIALFSVYIISRWNNK